ncbi:hypothetical protein CERSUDRAFT_79802 [Gelatoporia subvermispora B]|uniref:Uncharacterized protein n=1 Tax=Ceriporiopsis subvermispora (strain B) TaxID=914234 RepID=M2QYG3_CERS8|nr:hypothetical protein CERSUDRAFT_79802 [Gelatoporia subvermispora B]
MIQDPQPSPISTHPGSSNTANASVSSFSKTHSVRSSRAAPSTIKTVVTAPPWARDEPPSPTEQVHDPHSFDSARPLQPVRPSDVASYESSLVNEPGPSRWWAFTRQRGPPPEAPSSPRISLARQSTRFSTRTGRDRSLSFPWLSPTLRRSEDPAAASRGKEPVHVGRASNSSGLQIDIPPPPTVPFTRAYNETPGWDTPWTSRPLDLTHRGQNFGEPPPDGMQHDDGDEKLGTWARRKKRLRAYMMYNVYVPLLFRFINIAFTTAALAVAIRIRLLEQHNGVMGALGSSPTLVIIFASLTLVHVMIAIYVEYLGRPVGLWRTSSKLAYTLIEVVFICAWSAALALSFDNFFTSLIPCAAQSSITWYSQLPRPVPSGNATLVAHGLGDRLCDQQLALICLVGIGLIMYCINLVISLFRIFEKVKYHPTGQFPS